MLNASPDSAELRLALARLYQGARQPSEALRLAETLLRRDPRDLDARRSAVEAAIALRDRDRAELMVREAMALSPRDARVTVLEARVARAFGDDSRARRLLATAEAQREQETGRPVTQVAGPGGQPAAWTGLENPFLRGGATAGRGQSVIAAPLDPVGREIASARAQIEDDQAVRLGASVSGRLRSGSSGLDRLDELSGNMSASIGAGALPGRFTATVTPVSVNTGTMSADDGTRRRFGTNMVATTPQAGRETTAYGGAVNLAYQASSTLRGDVGTTPLGFHTQNVVGGFEIAPAIGENLRVRITGERRAITDSLLAWAGTRDERTGAWWGGVTRLSGRGQIEIPIGAGYIYAGGGYSRYSGQRVLANTRLEGGAGFGYPLLKTADSELSSGLDLVWFSFENNLRYFTLGHGGYFSPQSYTAINIPIDYRSRWGDLTYRVGGSVGYATFREDETRVFPSDQGLQSLLERQVTAGTNSGAISRFPSQSRSGIIGTVRGEADYAITPNLSIGGAFRYDKAANFDETRVLLRLNNRF
jgi:hypothetical protein